jgi:hypothetical protein
MIMVPDYIENDSAPESSQDKLDRVRDRAAQARDLERDISQTEKDLEEMRSVLSRLLREDLVTLMSEAGITSLTLEPKGNEPPKEVSLVPEYRAGIPVGWPAPLRAKGFEELERCEAGSLIKTKVEIAFPKGDRELVQTFVGKIRKSLEDLPEVKVVARDDVHHGTLTAWMKERLKKGLPVDLEAIGGYAGQVVKLKDKL